MPVVKVKGGYRWGDKGKVYKTKAQAARQGKAIKASKTRKTRKPGSMMARKRMLKDLDYALE